MVIHAGVGCRPTGVGSGHGCAVMAAVGTTELVLAKGHAERALPDLRLAPSRPLSSYGR
jgi:hypothetical protein